MKRRWLKITFFLLALGLCTVALSGGIIMQANAMQGDGPSTALSHTYYYGPANCHSDPTLPDTSGDKQQYADYIVNTIAPRYHLEAAILLWQVNQESGFNPNAVSSAGAIGIAQFMPNIAAAYGVDPTNPWESLDGMARYDLDSLRAFWGWSHTIAVDFGGNRNAYAWGLALAAYNAGGPQTGAAVGWASQQGWYDGPWTWLWWFGNANQTFYYVPDILGCEATS